MASQQPGTRRRSMINGWWARISEAVESRLWPVPVASVVLAVVLGVAVPSIDVIVDAHLPTGVDAAVFNGGADTARSVLSSIAGSLITATSLTFSLTVIALQLASSQASPRVLRLFARDRQVHWTLATFLGTFAYSIAVLRSVRSAAEDSPEFVPRIAVTIAFVLTLVSVVTLVFFLAHLAAQLRVETMLKDIHAETDDTIDRVGEANAAAPAFHGRVEVPQNLRSVPSDAGGFVTRRNDSELVQAAERHDIVVQVASAVGTNIVPGLPLAFWWPANEGASTADADQVDAALRGAYAVGYERTAAEDVGYGVQQIVDIALRALSPGTNDPLTAVHALGHLTALITRLVAMPRLPPGLSGEDGRLRVITMSSTPAQDIDQALTPLRHYGAAHPAVAARFIQTCAEVSRLCADASVDAALTDQLDALLQQLRADQADPASSAHLVTSALTTRQWIAAARPN